MKKRNMHVPIELLPRHIGMQLRKKIPSLHKSVIANMKSSSAFHFFTNRFYGHLAPITRKLAAHE